MVNGNVGGFWMNYHPEEYNQVFDCEDGDHVLQITGVEPKKSKNNNDMINISYKVDDIPIYYVEHYTDNELFNKMITRFFDAFKIERGNFNFKSWFGKTGKGHFIHKEESYQDSEGNIKNTNKCRLQYLIVEQVESANENVQSIGIPEKASDVFDNKIKKTPSPMSTETANELNKMFESGQFTQPEAMTYFNQYNNGEIEPAELLLTVKKEYNKRLNAKDGTNQNNFDIF